MTVSVAAPSRVSPAEPAPAVIASARAIIPILTSNAAAADRSGKLTVPILAALRSSGLVRIGAPASAGGADADRNTIGGVSAVLAEGHASAAWIVGSTAQAAGEVAADPVLRDIVFGGGEAPMVCDARVSAGEAVPVPGGYRVSGRWHSIPGAAHAEFALVSVVPRGAGGDAALRTVVTMSEAIRHDAWGAAGMRSAGAMTIGIDGLFIPEDRFSPAPLQRGYDPTHALVPASVVVGTAGGALDHALRSVRHRPWSGTRYRTASDSAIIQARLTDAAMHFSGARLHVHRMATTIDDVLDGFVEMDTVTRIRCRVDAGCAASAAMATMDAVMSAIGAEAVAESAPFARAWRDVQTLTRHGAVDPLTAREAYGRFLVAEDRTIPGIPL